MLIPKSQWIKYKNKLAAISQKAADEMEKFILSNPDMDSDELIGLANALEEWYGDAAAELACEMYDAVAEAQKASVPPAEPAEPSTFQEVAKAVNGARKRSEAMVPDTVGRLVKQRAADTTLKNAKRDGAFFAWVPQGDTCPYCMALAGIGWQRAGKKTLKGNHAEHIHANCDCAYVVDFKGDLKVEGYDPDEYDRKIRELTKDGPDGEYGAEDLLRAAGHNAKGSSYDAINQIRRQQYAANPEKYRAQKRAAYERRKELNERERDRLKTSYPNTVQMSVLDAPGYTGKFNGITGVEEVDKAVYESALEILDHRTGTNYEDLHLIDADTGEIIHKLTTCDIPNGVDYDAATLSAIEKAHDENRRIIAIHNHPGGLPPSLDDGVSAHDHVYVKGIAVGHNLEVYEYSATDQHYSKTQCEELHQKIREYVEFSIEFDDKVWYNALGEYGMEVSRR